MADLELFWPSMYRPAAITQRYGERPEYYKRFGLKGHEGVDFRAPTGTPIIASLDGVVQIATFGKTYGNQVWLGHDLEGSTVQTLYAHLDKIKPGLKRGQQVKRGEVIGWAGNTGNSEKAHLHFGLRVGGRWVDAQPYLVVPEQ